MATQYLITLRSWEKHNGTNKKGHTHFLVSKRIFDDPAIVSMCLSARYLYLRFIGACADQHASNFLATHEQLVSWCGGTGQRPERYLHQMQELQLLTYEKKQLFINRMDKKGLDNKGLDKKSSVVSLVPKNDEVKKQAIEIWEAYKEAYLERYKVEPIRNASVNSKISQLAKRLGQHGPDVVRFFLTHNDQFYLKTTHAIGGCLTNAESLLTQMQRGKAVTGLEARSAEKSIGVVSQAEMFRRMSEQV